MIVCGKHGQQDITTTENFYDGTVFTLACCCRGTVAELAEGWPAPPEPGPLTSEQLASFVARLAPEQVGELRDLLPPPAETAQAELDHLDEIQAPTLAEAVTAALATPTPEEAPAVQAGPTETEAEPTPEPDAAQTSPEATPGPPADLPPATPAAVAHADALGVDLTEVEGSGADGKILKADVEAAAPTTGGEPDGSPNG